MFCHSDRFLSFKLSTKKLWVSRSGDSWDWEFWMKDPFPLKTIPFRPWFSPLCGSQNLICRLNSPQSSTTIPLPPLCPIPIFPSSVSALKEIGIHGYVGTGKCVSKEKGRLWDQGPLGISRKGILCFLNACLAFKKRRDLGLVFCRKGNQCCKKVWKRETL